MNAPATEAATSALLTLIERLTLVFDRENRALADLDHRAIHALLPEKRAALDAYEDAVKALPGYAPRPAQGEVRRPSTSPAVHALRRAAERLDRSAEENRRRLAASIEAHRRFLGLFANAARESAPTAGAYGRGGAKGRSGFGSAAPTALSLDRAL